MTHPEAYFAQSPRLERLGWNDYKLTIFDPEHRMVHLEYLSRARARDEYPDLFDAIEMGRRRRWLHR